ncbi:MAG: bifunctional diaminohydroxyphosphoribosylaminopyrimidine deaminase/5-amino-6-(5-phosphoribosylamino)uracil reductase RibD [Planctomycetes bacterium]|nr:bifunctional diaminohydroxyphosphoribosylaminopyrimidine deaminase/5-amino-6-(5-phosphoribosylamino)uracil reductase RibD [Planctomycetota bacterium]
MFSPTDIRLMRRALELAGRGQGRVEPNPMVGAVVAAAGHVVAEGWHNACGGPHAEAVALARAGGTACGGTLYVTLEPCCHRGKTPPCTEAIVAAGIVRVVAAAGDPYPEVAGGGFAALRSAGVTVESGLLEAEAIRLTAAFRMLVEGRRPWVIAKWATSLDGRLAAEPGGDRWISSPASRALAHQVRGRVDGVVVGIGTALADDPLLTARPEGPRRAIRIVLDGTARLPLESRLVRTARDWPLLVAVGPLADAGRLARLRSAGCEVWQGTEVDPGGRLEELLRELGRRRLTNLLVEGGAHVLSTLFARGLVDEIHAFTAARLIGGDEGTLPTLPDPPAIEVEEVLHPGGDLFVRGVVRRPRKTTSSACPE